MKIKITLAQLISTHDPEKNLDITRKALVDAKAEGADIVLFPELWTIAYSDFPEAEEEIKSWKSKAFREGHELFEKYAALAKEVGVAYTLNFLEANEEQTEFYNASVLIDMRGEVALRYRKTHTVDKAWERMLTAGERFEVVELNTKKGAVKVGTMICYDREFPEVARILMLEGAEIILTPNACGLEGNRIAQFQSRGFENMLCVAMTNYPAPKNNGMSVAFDGMRERGTEYDPTLALLDDSEQMFTFELDLEKLREYRWRDIWGNAYRRPHLYKRLLDEDVQPPFVRDNARR